MITFTGKQHTFHFNGDYSGQILVSNVPITDNGYGVIDGEDFMQMAKTAVGTQIVGLLEDYLIG